MEEEMMSDMARSHRYNEEVHAYFANNNISMDFDYPLNDTNNTVVLHAMGGYSTLHIIISSIVLTFMMIVVVIGNMLVIIAIATEKSLKNLQNWFIASLAVADFFVGLLIMPFSLANELMGYWIFGSVWCSIHSAMDVMLCTSSIMNICLISLDRYWSITQAVDYLKKRTPARAAVMIGMVWVLSALISIPPLLGWRGETDETQYPPDAMNTPLPTCQLSREIGYVLYSALGSFYIPSCIMVFVYIRIYFAARARARRAVRKPPKAKAQLASIEVEDHHHRGLPPTPTTKTIPSIPVTVDTSFSKRPVPSESSCLARFPNQPSTPDGRTVKQVGFQDPLETLKKTEVIVRPEIMVERCSPEEGGVKVSTKVEVETNVEAQLKISTEESEPSVSECAINVDIVIINQAKDETVQDGVGGVGGRKVDDQIHQHQQSNTGESSLQSFPPKKKEEGLVETELSSEQSEENCGGGAGSQPLVPTIQFKRGLEAAPPSPHQSRLAVSELESAIISELQSNGASHEVANPSSKRSKRNKLHFLKVETPTIWRTSSSLSLNGDVHILGTLSRSCSRLQLDTDPVSDVEPSSSDSGAVSRCGVVKPLKLRLCQPFFGKKSSSASNKARRDVLDMGKLPSPKVSNSITSPPPHQEIRDPEREKRRIARKKEKRATLILGLIMGSFILCWLPFFFLYILEPLCPSCQVAPWGFAIAFWLGYMNSALNPVIYTIFNKDFRRAFRRILFK